MSNKVPADNGQIWWAYIQRDLYLEERRGYFWEKNTSICNPLNLLFFLFLSIKLVFRHLSCRGSCEMCSWLISKVNDKVNNKDTIDAVLASLLLTFNTFDYLLQSFYFWIWSVNCRLELLLVVLTLCSCWNQFRKSFHFWRN